MKAALSFDVGFEVFSVRYGVSPHPTNFIYWMTSRQINAILDDADRCWLWGDR